MGRGGKRAGAGRPNGAINKSTQAQKATLVDMAKAYAPEALEMLAEVMRYGTSDAARIAACVAILDRGYGRPRQADPEPAQNSVTDWIREIQARGSKPILSGDPDSPAEAPLPSDVPDRSRTPHSGGQLCLKIAEK